ncbi:MAG: hypothetical protein IKF83_04415 [Clostridia bacterium]|nr:hypothetical protein [Clostridia bacterium]
MEKVMSTEDKIRRAEEIYNRRRENKEKSGMTKVNINDKKDIKLLKKIFIQVIVCLAIYSIFYLIKHNNYIFSEDFINKSNEILSYDINFKEIYNKGMELIKNEEKTDDNTNNTEENNNEETNQEGIGGAEENTQEEQQQNNELSQMEQDAINIKQTINFINPIEGTITSSFGWRNPTTNTVPKFHTGIDIANVKGTKIFSATDGNVILASNEGDYRKSPKSTD